jgi:glycosyltransferase involved in cell wall biosynthesis
MGGVQRVTYLSSHLVRLGWNVTVLTVRPFEYPAYDRTIAEKLPRSIRVLRVTPIEQRIPKRLFSEAGDRGEDAESERAGPGTAGWAMLPDNKILSIAGMLRSIRAVVRQVKPDAVITSSPPPSIHLVGCYLRKYFGIRWLADYRDIWFSQSKTVHKTSLHRRLHSYLEGRFVTDADRTVVVSDGHLDKLRASYRAAKDRFHLIPNGYEESMFAETTSLTEQNDTFRIGYCGTLNHLTYVPGMFEALVDMSESHSISIDVCGMISPHVQKDINRLDPDRRLIHLHGYKEHQQAVEFRMRCDANLITLAPDRHLESTIPGKVYETLRTPRPVIGIIPRDSSTWKLLSRFGDVILVDASNIAGSKDMIVSMTRSGRPDVGKRTGIDQFSWETLAGLYDRLLKEVTA